MIGEDFLKEVQEAKERELVDTIFEEIREHTSVEEAARDPVGDSRVGWSEEPDFPDVDDLNEARKHAEVGSCLRIDAGGKPISVDLLIESMERLHKKRGFDPTHEGDFQFWVHARLKRELQNDPDMRDTGIFDDGTLSIYEVPVLGFDYFPKAAVLLIDPERTFEQVHTLGQAEPVRVVPKDLRRVLRITGIGRPD